MSQPTTGDQERDPADELMRTGFCVRSESSGGAVVLRLQGELDMATAVELRRAVTEGLDSKPSAMTLDLTEFDFVDSSGIGVLVGANRRAGQVGCAFALRSPRRPVQKALQVTGVDQLMHIEHPS